MRIDLHFHTAISDGVASPETMVKTIKKKGLDGFAATDHDKTGNVKEYKELAEKYGLVYLCGIEITAQEGHILAYTLPETADLLEHFVPLQPFQVYVKKAKSLPVLLGPAHPFDFFRYGVGRKIFEGEWSCLETFNGSTVFPFSNRRAREAARILHLPEIGGSDAHDPYYVGEAYTEACASTVEEFVNQIKKGETATGGIHQNAFQFAHRMVISKIFK